jgi:hypothetical protein
MNHFRKRLTTELSISTLIVLALLGGIVYFRGSVKDYTKNIVAARTLLANRTASIGNVADLRIQYDAKVVDYMNVLHNVIPSYDELINLNKEFQSLAARDGLEYGFSFLGETPKSEEGLGSISFNLNLSSSSLKPLISFVKSLQNFRYLNSIDNISVKTEDDELTMNVTARIFYR